MRLLPLLLATLLTAAPTLAAPVELLGQAAGQTARQGTAARVQAAQGAVNAALKQRKQRWRAWEAAEKARDAAAAAVANKKRAGVTGAPLEEALQHALNLDEAASAARSSLLTAEAAVAERGAELLRLYDALLLERRRAIESMPAGGRNQVRAAAAYRQLAAQRDAVRQALAPVLEAQVPSQGLPAGVDLEARPGDDVEDLLEKADLARDLEVRFLRQAEAVRERIRELEAEQAVASEVMGMVGRNQLFDEEDRRLVVVRSQPGTPSSPSKPGQATTVAGPSPVKGAPAEGDPTDVREPGTQFEGLPVDPNGPSAPAPPVAPPTLAGVDRPQSTSGSTVLRSEQGLSLLPGPATTALTATSSRDVAALRALEAKLAAEAKKLAQQSRQLKAQASTRD